MAVQTAHPAEETAKSRPEIVAQTSQPPSNSAERRLRSLPPPTLHRWQQRQNRGRPSPLGAAPPTPYPPDPLRVSLLGRLGAGARSARRESRLHGAQRRIPVGAQILGKQRVADSAARAPNPTQRLKLTAQTATVRTMTLKATTLAARIGTAHCRDCLADPFQILLAADTRQDYHGLLSEARRPLSPDPPRNEGRDGGLRCLCGNLRGRKNVPLYRDSESSRTRWKPGRLRAATTDCGGRLQRPKASHFRPPGWRLRSATAVDLSRCLKDLMRMRSPLPRLERTGSTIGCSPAPRRPSPSDRRVGSSEKLSRPAQGSLALRPAHLHLGCTKDFSGGFGREITRLGRSSGYRGVPTTPRTGLSPAGLRDPGGSS